MAQGVLCGSFSSRCPPEKLMAEVPECGGRLTQLTREQGDSSSAACVFTHVH